MNLATRFTEPDAVEVWDAEFRWRADGRLRDVTIDDTWHRIAAAAAGAEGTHAAMWVYPFADSFRRWRLLPDERILRSLGTSRAPAAMDEPAAVLNVAAFVSGPPLTRAYFDREQFIATAALAVRFLDDAAASVDPGRLPLCLRIGIIGLADALRALGLPYGSDEGRRQAVLVARALAEGCVRGSIELVEERGRRFSADDWRSRAEWLHRRKMPAGLIGRVLRSGMAHVRLTAVDAHPLLARLANGVADSIDPLDGSGAPAMAPAVLADRLVMGATIQPWMDVPVPAPPSLDLVEGLP